MGELRDPAFLRLVVRALLRPNQVSPGLALPPSHLRGTEHLEPLSGRRLRLGLGRRGRQMVKLRALRLQNVGNDVHLTG